LPSPKSTSYSYSSGRRTGVSSIPRGASQLKREIRTASILKDGRAVLNIAGNKYRIVVWINYPYRVVYVRFIGTHSQHDKIDAQIV
jgi:mRNA interferase HigB